MPSLSLCNASDKMPHKVAAVIVTVQVTDALSRLCSHGPSDSDSRRAVRKSLPESSAAAVTVSVSGSLTGIGCRLPWPGPAVGLSRSRSPLAVPRPLGSLAHATGSRITVQATVVGYVVVRA